MAGKSQFSTLIGARLTAIRNRATQVEVGERLRLGVGVLVGVGILLVLGHFAAPGLLEPPTDVATGGGFRGAAETLPRGTNALEAAFWLTVLAASVLGFRVMEILFRRADVRVLDPYPVELPVLFVDRVGAAMFEALGVSLAIGLFFVPLVWHGAPLVALLCVAILALGLVTSSAIGLAIQVYAGHMNVRMARDEGGGVSGDIYGGPGQVFLFSPGLALAISAILILLARLTLGEVLNDREITRAFWFGVGLLAVISVIGLGVAYRHFTDAFPAMAARFREADMTNFEPPVDYQKSAYEETGFFEGRLTGAARAAYRTMSLQYGRRYLLTRYSYPIGWLIGGLAVFRLSRDAFPIWAALIAPAVAVATFANPWARLMSKRLRPDFADRLPFEPDDEFRAAALFGAREVVLLSGPYALLAALAYGLGGDWFAAIVVGLGSVLACLLLNAAVALMWRWRGRGFVAEIAAPFVTCVLLLAIVASL